MHAESWPTYKESYAQSSMRDVPKGYMLVYIYLVDISEERVMDLNWFCLQAQTTNDTRRQPRYDYSQVYSAEDISTRDHVAAY